MSDPRKRNWQRVAHNLCDQWLDNFRWPAGGAQLIGIEALRKLLRGAYVAGYRSGRENKK